MSNNIVKLEEVCSFINGDRGKNYPSAKDFVSEGIPFVNAGHITNNKINFSNMNYISEDKYNQLGSGKLKENDIIYCLRGSLGKQAIVSINKGAIASSLVILRSNNKIISNKYLSYCINSKPFYKQQLKANNGSSQPNLSATSLKKFEISLPSLEVQKRITETLDTASELLTLRKLQLADLDNLIKSIFYNMFGDPVTNEKGWKLKKLPHLVAKSKNSLKRGPFGGALKKEIFINEGYLVYEQNHALNNDYSFKRYFIDHNTFNELKDFEVKTGDILISCSGVYLGKLSIVPKDALPGIINQALLKVTLNNKEMNQVFFVYVFSNPTFKSKNITSNRGSGIPNLPPMAVMKNIDFITPPINLQNKFATIVIKIEEQKALVKKAIDETQYLFDSLMAEYFE